MRGHNLNNNFSFEDLIFRVQRVENMIQEKNQEIKLTIHSNDVIVKDSPRFTISFLLSVTINKDIKVEQDHVLILFKRRTE